MVIMLLECECL